MGSKACEPEGDCTSKPEGLYARGPMGLKELTSYKWIVRGSGQVRG